MRPRVLTIRIGLSRRLTIVPCLHTVNLHAGFRRHSTYYTALCRTALVPSWCRFVVLVARRRTVRARAFCAMRAHPPGRRRARNATRTRLKRSGPHSGFSLFRPPQVVSCVGLSPLIDYDALCTVAAYLYYPLGLFIRVADGESAQTHIFPCFCVFIYIFPDVRHVGSFTRMSSTLSHAS